MIDRLLVEFTAHRGKNNGALAVTYKNFEEFGVDPHAIRKGLNELIALGFVRIEREGRAGNAEFRKSHLYRVTWIETSNQEATNEWCAIPAVGDARKFAKLARRTSGKAFEVPLGMAA